MIELLGGYGARTFKFFNDYFMKDTLKSQLQLLDTILKTHKSTLFGKDHKFDDIHSVKQFQEHCQPHSYDYFRPYIDKHISGTKNALINTPLISLAETTGTTGHGKLIPVTYHTLKSYSLGIFRTSCYYIAGNPGNNSQIIGGKWLYLGAPPLLRYVSGIPVGFITGQMILPVKNEFWRYLLNSKYYAPLNKYPKIRNVEEKFRIIAKEALSKKITIVVGTPSVVVNSLELIQKFNDGKEIKKLFPKLHFAVLSGSPPKFYEAHFKELFGEDFSYREMYAATEGMLAGQLSEKRELTPFCDSIFFEFVPLKNTSERLLINQIKKGEEYSLLISSHNGLYAYEISDVVKITSENPPAFEFSHRKNTLDLTGEKLTTSQIYDAVVEANKQTNCKLVDFCVIASYIPKPRYIFMVEFVETQRPKSLEKYLASIDDILVTQVGYHYYRVHRKTLLPPELWVLKNKTFHLLQNEEFIEKMTEGQLKTTRFSQDPKLLGIFEPHAVEKIIGN